MPVDLAAIGLAVEPCGAFRPEFEPPWIGQPHVTALTLNRLAEREVGAMIDHLVGDKVLPEGIRQDIIERTDGIPKEDFLEVSAHYLTEAIDRWILGSDPFTALKRAQFAGL